MKSLSQIELTVINFLVRNFSRRLTVRSIAKELKTSAAGAYQAVKKLEESGILVFERLGTGLFYNVDLENPIARHLAAIVLLEGSAAKTLIDLSESAKRDATAAIVLRTEAVIISHKGINSSKCSVIAEHDFEESLRMRDKKALSWLAGGKVIYGENFIVNAIGKSISRF
ncbi:MAG: hypothetical protein ABH879_09160 [archaeon]